ncbi:MAG: hypothetical protein ACLP6E_03220 [Acidimicrobiales bacterium]
MRRLPVLISVGALVALASACNVTSPAATVNGTQISESSFQSELQQIASNSSVRCAIGLLTGQTIPAQGAGSSTVPTKVADTVLDQQIEQVLYTQDLSRLHTSPGSVYTSFIRDELPDFLTPASGVTSPCGLSGSQLVSALPGWFVNQEVSFLSAQARLATALDHTDIGPAAVEAYYNSSTGRSEFEEDCLDALAASSQSAANAARLKLLAGASFESVVRSSSINDTAALEQDGFTATGALPCVPSVELVDDLPNWAGALVQVNQRKGDPAPAFLDSSQVDQGGTNEWLVIELVRTQEAPINQQITLDIQGALLSQSEQDLAAEQTRLLGRASVTIDPQFGSWKPGTAGSPPEVEAPPLPKSEYLLNRSADLGNS